MPPAFGGGELPRIGEKGRGRPGLVVNDAVEVRLSGATPPATAPRAVVEGGTRLGGWLGQPFVADAGEEQDLAERAAVRRRRPMSGPPKRDHDTRHAHPDLDHGAFLLKSGGPSTPFEGRQQRAPRLTKPFGAGPPLRRTCSVSLRRRLRQLPMMIVEI